MEKINHTVVNLLNCWHRYNMQAIRHCKSLFCPFAICFLVAVLMYTVFPVWRRQLISYGFTQLESLPDYSPAYSIQKYTCEQNGTSFVGELFYTFLDGDIVTAEDACGIESTLKSNPYTNCYIIILSSITSQILKPTTKDRTEIYAIIAKYDNAILLNVDGERYFAESPLHNLWNSFESNSPLRKFATRVLTIWRYGGTTYDSHLLTLQKDSVSALPDLKNSVIIDLNHGLIMSAQQKCNAFLFEVVKVLAVMGQDINVKLSEKEVLSKALARFCDKVQTTSNTGEFPCTGVKDLPPGLLCYTNESDLDCKWGYSMRNASKATLNSYAHFCETGNLSYNVSKPFLNLNDTVKTIVDMLTELVLNLVF